MTADEAATQHRSQCPINLAVEIFGDRWTLIILRDMIFGGARHFRELLRSQEGISSNILSDRLARLVREGMLTKSHDPTHRQKAIYSLTEKSIALVPVLAQIGDWGSRFLPVSEALSIRAKVLAEGGSELWEQFMSELREEHLGVPLPSGPREAGQTVTERLQAAYEAVNGGTVIPHEQA